MVSLSAVASQEGQQVTKVESALEARDLVLQAQPGLASRNSTLRAATSRIRSAVETFDRERRKMAMLT